MLMSVELFCWAVEECKSVRTCIDTFYSMKMAQHGSWMGLGRCAKGQACWFAIDKENFCAVPFLSIYEFLEMAYNPSTV